MTLYTKLTPYELALERQRAVREADRVSVREIDAEFRIRATQKPAQRNRVKIDASAERKG